MTEEPISARSNVRGGSAIAVAIGVMNVATYLFTILAARLMGPQSFGAFAAVMNVLLVASVLALALQATAARRIAHEPEDVLQVESTILLVGRRTALGLGLAFLLLSPVVDLALRLDSIGAAVVLAAAVVPTTLMGAQAGVLQGERRWLPLALVYLCAGVPRLVLGVVLLSWRPDELVAMIAVTAGACAPVVVGTLALRKPRAERPTGPATGSHTARELWWETVYNSQALLAFLVLSSVDIVLARNALAPHAAGLYAGGLILAKAVMFLPQFVVVLAFPSMGTEGGQRSALLASLGLVASAGVAVTIGVRVLPTLALTFIGGNAYAAISDRLWVFAVLGTVLSMIQLLVYSVLARQARNSTIVLWVSLVPLVVAGLTSSTFSELVGRVLTVDSTLLVVLLAISLWRLRHDVPPVPATTVRDGSPA